MQGETGLRAKARPFAIRYSQYLQAIGAAVGVVPPEPTPEHLNPCCKLSEYEQRNVSLAACLQAGGTSEETACDSQRYCCNVGRKPPSYAATCESGQRRPLSECELDWQCCRISDTEQLWLTSSDCSAQAGSVVEAKHCNTFFHCCSNAADDEVVRAFEPCSAVSRPLEDCEDGCCADGTAGEAAFDEQFNCVRVEGKMAVGEEQCKEVCCRWDDEDEKYSNLPLYDCLHVGTKEGEESSPSCNPPR